MLVEKGVCAGAGNDIVVVNRWLAALFTWGCCFTTLSGRDRAGVTKVVLSAGFGNSQPWPISEESMWAPRGGTDANENVTNTAGEMSVHRL